MCVIKNGDKASNTRQYNKKLEEFDKLSSIDLENGFDFPSEEVCPYLSIRAKKERRYGRNHYKL